MSWARDVDVERELIGVDVITSKATQHTKMTCQNETRKQRKAGKSSLPGRPGSRFLAGLVAGWVGLLAGL